MNRLRWWMRIVGVFYLVLGAGFIPFINEARLPLLLPAFNAPPASVEYKALIDWMFVFGLDLVVIGAILIYASRDPRKNVILIWTVIWLEAIRGALDDIYYLSRGYAAPAIYVPFIAIHLIIIGTGIVFVRLMRREEEVRP